MALTRIRFATPADAATIVRFVRALAAYDKEPLDSVKLTPDDVLRDGFGDRPCFEVLLAELGNRPVGFALFFHNYSTWAGHPGIYIEDLFVDEEARGLGLGFDLMAAVAKLAQERGCTRVDLSVLHWNPARDFYHQLGMKQTEDWLPYRLTQPQLGVLAARAGSIDPSSVADS